MGALGGGIPAVGRLGVGDTTDGESRRTVFVSNDRASTVSVAQVDGIRAGGDVTEATA